MNSMDSTSLDGQTQSFCTHRIEQSLQSGTGRAVVCSGFVDCSFVLGMSHFL